MYGSFPCDIWPDIKILKSEMVNLILKNEKLVSDNGYKHIKSVTPCGIQSDLKKIHSRICARHETCNVRLKTFIILSENFRQGMKSHGVVFHAMSKFLSVKIIFEQPLIKIYMEL